MSENLKSHFSEIIDKALNEGAIDRFDNTNSKIELLEELSIYYRELQFQNEELRETQEKLLETKNELSDILDFSPIGFVIFDINFTISYCNEMFAGYLCLKASEIVGNSLQHYIAPESQDDFYFYGRKLNIINSAEKRQNIELKFLSKTKIIVLRMDTAVSNNKDARKFIATFIDLTKETENNETIKTTKNELENTVNRLKESEHKFRLITENLNDGILYVNNEYKITYASPSYIKLNSIHSNEIYLTKEQIYERVYADDRNELFEKIFIAINNREENLKYSYRIYLTNNEISWREDNTRFVYDNNKENFVGAYIITRDVTERVNAYNMLKEYQDELMKFSKHLQTIREDERNMLAREIHDDLGQILVALKIDIGLFAKNFQNSPSTDPSINTKFNEIIHLVDRTIKTARRIIADLRSDELEVMSLFDAISNHICSFEKRYNIKCKYSNSIDKLEFSDQQRLAIYRIVQEALNNIAKHAAASYVSIKSHIENNMAVLIIEDNGNGFNVSAKQNEHSYGLISIKERARMINAMVEIKSEIGVGTLISLTIPINESSIQE